ncbi:metallophosphoesterase [Planctomycetales bacterium ZRK34]|nr:metallophosphoesterase [Planctomycetales bacterium ZRK34]
MSPHDKKHRRKRQRAAFRHAVFTRGAVRLSGGRLARPRPGKDFAVNHRVIDLPRLPDELCGLTITHLSDLHVGELVTPAHLPYIVEAANALESDLIAVTGDFVDFSNVYLPAIIEAMKQLAAPLGVYFVLGNHDFLDNGQQVADAFLKAGLNLLLNNTVDLEHYEKRITVGGINWADKHTQIARDVRATVNQMPKADLRLLLAHHPHAFDAARRRGVDLTLSGHTHGGQVLLSNKRGKKGSIGLANFGFRYTRGLYQHGDSRLFVSSGVGSWFPLRIRCPAEITRLELQSRY